MGDSAEHDAAGSDMGHRFRDIDPLLMIANDRFPTDHPAKVALDDRPPGQNLEPRLLVGAQDADPTPETWPRQAGCAPLRA